MRLIFLGSASAFVCDSDNFQSNMVLQSDSGKLLLIDCGADARRSLHILGWDHRDISDVYISHLHADHAGGLEWLAFCRKFDENHLVKPNLYISQQIAGALWEHTLSGGLTSLSDEKASLSAFFQVHEVPDGQSFEWEQTQFQLIENRHIESRFAHMPSYGLFFRSNRYRVYLTTDAQFQPESSLPFYLEADFIFQDCETLETPSGVHANYQQLRTLDPEIKKKMWLYHYNHHYSALPNPAVDGFAGFVLPSQSFEV